MNAKHAAILLLAVGLNLPAFAQPAPPKPDQLLFDFNAQNWSVVENPDAKAKEPDATVSADNGKLQITFAGGQFPAVGTSTVPIADWSPFNAVKVDVTAPRHCVVGFRARTDQDDPKDMGTRWEVTSFLNPGLNELVLPINKQQAKFASKNVISVAIYMYTPAAGESLLVDNLRLANVKSPPPTAEFTVLGTDLKAKDPADLTAQLKDKASPPALRTIEQVEADFKARFDEIKKTNPTATLATFRDGENNYNGWKDAYIFSHGPDGTIYQRARNYSVNPTMSTYSRNVGFRIMQVDLSSIPTGSKILAAELVLVRRAKETKAEDIEKYFPSQWIAEACNRDWSEKEINYYQYATGKLWKASAGTNWSDADPDFLPLYLAHGPSAGKADASTWDFTNAVKYWTDGNSKNHGFAWHGPYTQDFWRNAPTRRAPTIKDRPALMVIYEPAK
ncbi:MAG: DNRLRE domain-containing protein [Phycisphaerales bacterium]|nr:DNRLRE domain-containing protein [Phycisphaerales bacterium]